ncbi:MAG: hypothetical protein Q9201_006928 [Fulgogasparrea decipioides]
MLYVVPADWQLLYLGSSESLSQVSRSISIQHHQKDGKLELQAAPQNASFKAQEQRNRLLTDPNFYKGYLPKAEWLLMYHADSILCANARLDLNDWLKYNYGQWRGGGGLSLRRVSRIQQVLGFQSRQDDEHPEDRWLIDRIKVLPGIKLPKPETEKSFAVEGVWAEEPMGFHIPSSDEALLREVWDDLGRRRQIFEYCPEVKMIMPRMKLERERCEEKTEGANGSEAEAQEQINKEMEEQIAEQAASQETSEQDDAGNKEK